MLIRNLDILDGLVNGVFDTVQQILPCKDEESLQQGIVVKFDNTSVGLKCRNLCQAVISSDGVIIEPISEEIGSQSRIRQQFPLQLAWACTVHKVQGMTVDAITVSLGKIFAPGQAYVALSRCTSVEGLMIKDLDINKIYCDESVSRALEQMPQLRQQPLEQPLPDSVNILLHNIQGLYPHFQDLVSNKDVHSCDFLCLTETWLRETDNLPSFLDFRMHHKCRSASYDNSTQLFTTLKQQLHGGVGFFSKSSTDFYQIDLGMHNIEYIAFNILSMDMAVILVYRPQTYTTSQFLQHLHSLLEDLQKICLRVILVGDLNENLMKITCPIRDFLQDYGYKQFVTEATTDGGTIIDHVYSNLNVEIKILPTYYSYHNMVSITLSPST